jgi:DNA repair exonuclease SbcCD nuclease subunit
MKKIAIFADVHLCEEYYSTIKEPLEFFVNYLRENKIDTAVLAGDYFDKRLPADSFAYKYGISKLGEISSIVDNLIILRGTYSHDYDSLDIIETISDFWISQTNIIYTKTMSEIEIDGKNILLLPEEYPEFPEEYYKENLEKQYDYIFGHGDINGAMLHSGIDNRRLKGFRFSPTILSNISKQTVFGHIHKQQFLKDNVSYPGSLARNKYGEEEDKGFLVIDCEEDKIEFVVTPSTTFKTLVIDSDMTEEELVEIKSKYTNLKLKIDKKDIDTSTSIKELLKKIDLDINIDLVGKYDDSEVLFKDIENKNILEQFQIIYDSDVNNKKIPLKKQTFFNYETINKVLQESLDLETK